MLGGRGGERGCVDYGLARALAWVDLVDMLRGASQRESKVGFCCLNISIFRQVTETNKVGYNDTWLKSYIWDKEWFWKYMNDGCISGGRPSCYFSSLSLWLKF